MPWASLACVRSCCATTTVKAPKAMLPIASVTTSSTRVKPRRMSAHHQTPANDEAWDDVVQVFDTVGRQPYAIARHGDAPPFTDPGRRVGRGSILGRQAGARRELL